MRTMIWLILALVIASVAGASWLWMRRVEASAVAATSLPPAHADAFLAPHRATLEASRRPVVRIELESFPQDELTVSKVGGRAWWPAGQAAPLGSDGEPLVLLAQVNFAEVPALAGYPAKGLLQFFIAGDDLYGANFEGAINSETLSVQRDFRVVYWPNISVPAQPLAVVAAEFTPHAPDKPRRMRFVAGEEVLTINDYRFDALFAAGIYGAAETYAKQHGISPDELIDQVFERHSGTGHKLGGYPFFTQSDPRSGGDWELLFQLDSDDEMMWGDVGVGGFFISPADLARGDFSRVAYNWDCH